MLRAAIGKEIRIISNTPSFGKLTNATIQNDIKDLVRLQTISTFQNLAVHLYESKSIRYLTNLGHVVVINVDLVQEFGSYGNSNYIWLDMNGIRIGLRIK